MGFVEAYNYEYDAFISYEHAPRIIAPWVNNFLYPYLEEWLSQKMGGCQARIFVDQSSIKPGQRWPQTLREALLRSKCLVPVFSGGYFYSHWCSSEWQNFVDRENILGLKNSANSLILPITHNDGKFLIEKAKEYNRIDFSTCHSPSDNFINEKCFPEFYRKTEELAEAVANIAINPPIFDPGWPQIEVSPLRTLSLTRLS